MSYGQARTAVGRSCGYTVSLAGVSETTPSSAPSPSSSAPQDQEKNPVAVFEATATIDDSGMPHPPANGQSGSAPAVRETGGRAAPSPTLTPTGRSRFREVIAAGEGELLLFGMTPPRLSTDPEKLPDIAEKMLSRLEGLALDAVVLYDLADESSRTSTERPYPFSETWDPAQFRERYMQGWPGQSIVYRSVGKYSADEITGFLNTAGEDVSTVFVGAPSADEPVRTTLKEAYALYNGAGRPVPMGGVAIPERHTRRGDEQNRLLGKRDEGCSYFVTQVMYDVRAAKDLASDYAYAVKASSDEGRPIAPLIFTLSVCGSGKSLEFMRWLGVDVPRWVANELTHSEDPLSLSASYSAAAARELMRFCRYLGIPFGFNVESVSNRRVEIEASVHLAQDLSRQLRRGGLVAGH